MKIELRNHFEKNFSEAPESLYFCPGRVNLIGEHIDYNGGMVMPGAISAGITALVSERNDGRCRLVSLNSGLQKTIELSKGLTYLEEDDWTNYPKAVAAGLIDRGHRLKGCNILYSSDLPEGAGLSSSAAIEVLTAYILLDLAGEENPDRLQIALLCQQVENNFIGVNCGIMDQYSVALGKADHCLLLDCASLESEAVPFRSDKAGIVIMNSNRPRALAESKYNERRAECETALEQIRRQKDIPNLCTAEPADVESIIKDSIILRRARHVVSEERRVRAAAEALKAGDMQKLGDLMVASHISLKDDYEVSSFELDTLVEEALEVPGCYGARMTGAGFGGCAVAVVDKTCMVRFTEHVSSRYNQKTGRTADIYLVSLEDGVHRLS